MRARAADTDAMDVAGSAPEPELFPPEETYHVGFAEQKFGKPGFSSRPESGNTVSPHPAIPTRKRTIIQPIENKRKFFLLNF
jgi:hypothetical protein